MHGLLVVVVVVSELDRQYYNYSLELFIATEFFHYFFLLHKFQ